MTKRNQLTEPIRVFVFSSPLYFHALILHLIIYNKETFCPFHPHTISKLDNTLNRLNNRNSIYASIHVRLTKERSEKGPVSNRDKHIRCPFIERRWGSQVRFSFQFVEPLYVWELGSHRFAD